MARERDNSVSLLSLNMPFLLLYIFRLFSVFPLRFSSVFSQIYRVFNYRRDGAISD